MTVLERSLLESMNLVQPEVEKMAVEIDELKEKLEKATKNSDMWYGYYNEKDSKVKKLEAEITTLKAQKKEQEVAASNSFDNLKEAI
ncbi:hypothetical protein [Sphaerochaeta globosa]|uniref:Uncharacterized protein n=1 Tax=Sphaerochaeta globosa (strain ATCC BAA-1886 / DSM 22777 / Buddy) TaxID=158189 RepID=F0RWN1_SPHGB|nr:hypothetical protein [Sphaerochaeta globosa]ADY13662.1 hypothetical protein SpiBuddy_1838 [Sphaerochaeta globosa str. Buddy]